MLPLARKSVEPLAASIDPHSVQARHQSLHHFVAKSDWSDTAGPLHLLVIRTPAYSNNID
jgi:SRSO17 transposase